MSIYMLVNYVTIISAIFITIISWQNKYEKAIGLFVLFSLVAPSVNILGRIVAYDLFAFPFLAMGIIGCRQRIQIRRMKKLTGLFFYFLFLTVATIVSVIFWGGSVMPIKYIGILRLILEIGIITIFGNRKDVGEMLKVAVVVNFVVILLQYFDKNSFYWTSRLYSTDTAISLRSITNNTLNRLTGTFSNTVPIAMFMIFMIFVSFAEICGKKDVKKNAVIMGMAFVCGFLSVSKAYIVLFFIVSLAWVVLQKQMRLSEYRVFHGRKIGGLLLLLILIVGGILIMPRLRFSAVYEYYINSLLSGNFMKSRFGVEGNQIEAIRVFFRHAFLGVGCTQINGEFLGDSEIVGILHDTGIVGFAIIEGFLLGCLYKSIRRRSFAGALCKIIILAVSVISNSLFSITGVVVFSYGVLLDREVETVRTKKNYCYEQRTLVQRNSASFSEPIM